MKKRKNSVPNMNPFLARFDQVPSMVTPELKGVFESCLHQASAQFVRIETDQNKPKMLDGDDFWFADDDWRAAFRPYNVKDGILQIPVKGVLLHDFMYQLGGWATGYPYIWKAFERGMGDMNVKGIALVIDSPGGEVAGNFDLVDKMFAMKGQKPVRAYAMESAYSAAYSIASMADTITVSRTGGVGSIGVVTAHVDVSKMMEEWGYKLTFIFAGAHKVDGNPYEALKPEVKARIQERIDELYSVFVSTVARNRGMDEQAIRDTEALTFTATQATSNGLADAIGSLDDAIAAFAVDLSINDEDENMADYTQAQYDEGTAAARAEGLSAGRAEGSKEGAKAQKDRINAIIGSDEGKVRPKAALSAALKTDMSVEDATAFLGDLAEEKAEAASTTTEQKPQGKSRFEQAMDQTRQPELGTASDGEQTDRPSRGRAAAAAAGRLKVVDNK